MKQLERLLFLQGGRCFFCAEVIPLGEASVEHLVAAANGGAKDDQNCVVCCKTVNAALGSLSVKAKLQAVLNQRGRFVCPAAVALTELNPDGSHVQPAQADRITHIVSDLVKRGPSRPRRVATLKNTINALFQKSLAQSDIEQLLAQMQSLGHIAIESEKVSYSLPTGQ